MLINRRAGDSTRRAPRFTEKLSFWMMVISGLGGFLILIDPQVAGEFRGWTFRFGSEGFSAELKGAVVTLILIGGWTAIKEYWFGSSASGNEQSKSVSRIAEASAPVAAAAVAAASTPGSLKTDDVKIDATNADISIDGTQSK